MFRCIFPLNIWCTVTQRLVIVILAELAGTWLHSLWAWRRFHKECRLNFLQNSNMYRHIKHTYRPLRFYKNEITRSSTVVSGLIALSSYIAANVSNRSWTRNCLVKLYYLTFHPWSYFVVSFTSVTDTCQHVCVVDNLLYCVKPNHLSFIKL